jgi:thiol-disulfide isomerase/thioredoxin
MAFPRRLLWVIFFLIFAGFFFPLVAISQEKTEIAFFYSSTCPHCAKEKDFLDELEEKYPVVAVNSYEASSNRNLLIQLYEEYEVPQDMWGYVPVSFVGENYWIGFSSDIGQEMETYVAQLVEGLEEQDDSNPPPEVTDEGEGEAEVEEASTAPEDSDKVTLPVFGEIDISKSGLLLFSILIGIIDGFNACAMWALCFLLTFLVACGSRKRIFLVGGTFIFVSGIIYFLFIATWLNAFLLIGYLKVIQVAISVLAIIFGLVCIKDFFAFGKGITFILPEKTREKVGEKMRKVTDPSLPLPVVLASVALLAAGVNAIELLCTTGFPAVFTNILAAQSLSTPTYYLYLLVYVFFYMLDDFLIFSAVVLTLGARKFPDKYKRVSKLVSGLLILALGLIMLVRPELLMFGA